MYKEHCPLIAAYMRETPNGFARGVTFVICSIRQRIYNVPAQMVAIDEGDLQYLFGHKRDAYAYVQERAADLLRDILAAVTVADAMDVITRVPGLGIVKGAFVLQLMGFDVACLDSRNIAREKRNPRAFDSNGRKETKAFARKIVLYLGETVGRAEEYWNAWCEDVAKAYDMAAEEVSALHLAIIPDNYIPF